MKTLGYKMPNIIKYRTEEMTKAMQSTECQKGG